jgi:LPS-assembly protein
MRPAFTLTSLLFFFGLVASLRAQQQEWVIEALTPEGSVVYDMKTGIATGTNGVMVKYGDGILVADRVSVRQETGDTIADGNVRIQRDDLTWTGEHIEYNFKTRRMVAGKFRAGRPPFFVEGMGLVGDASNSVYTATNGYITSDDYSEPVVRVRTKRLVIHPGERFEAHGATIQAGDVPVFYLPYLSRDLKQTSPGLMFTPGYRSSYGAFILAGYAWKWSDIMDSRIHVDYRSLRGPGLGPDLDWHLGRWGDAQLSYYYQHDSRPETNTATGFLYPENRQRLEFKWLASPYTNTTFRSRMSYQSDSGFLREFFESDYRNNPMPGSFLEANHTWDNYSLTATVAPRLDPFFQTVERLPEIKLSAFRQQIGASPFYYESESRVGYLRNLFAETNGPSQLDYEAARADTFHQIVLPVTLFGWLNLVPRAGGRLTYYSAAEGPGATTEEVYRGVFNTGAELSFKASRTWNDIHGGLLDLDGLRHIVVPSVNYVYIPHPSAAPSELPQFDTVLPSLRLLPIDFPDFNAIDSINNQNTVRLGLRNRLQTRRETHPEDVVDWDVFTDWHIQREAGEPTFSDISSELGFSPRTWLTLGSATRYDPEGGQIRMAYNSVTFRPNNTWSWAPGYMYLRDFFSTTDPTAWGAGGSYLTSLMYLRLNENWGFRMLQYFDARNHQVTEQVYTVYRDFRTWTGALSIRFRDNPTGSNTKQEFAIAFTYSLKALPQLHVGKDTIDAGSRFGY